MASPSKAGFGQPDATLSVLDVGTGTGFFALMIASLSHQVTGVDVSPNMLSVAEDNSRRAGLDIAFREADIHDLPPTSGRSIW